MTMTTKPVARTTPLGIRRLPDAEHVACRACGEVCGPDAPREAFTVLAYIDHLGVREYATPGEVTFATCNRCAALDAHAAATLDAHPMIRRAIGSPSIGRHRIASAFHALAVLGLEPAETYSVDGILSLLDRLAVPGAAASWARRFSPVRDEHASQGTAAAKPWLHVDSVLRAEIRRQYTDHLADRMPERAVACPTRGCAWCGLGSVMAKRTAKPWTPHNIGTASLGGSPSPRNLDVHLCPTCESVREDGGSMRSAVLDLIDPGRLMRRRRPYEPEVNGVRGWAVAGGSEANSTPFAHLDLDGLHALLVSSDW